ncbi:helix-turn-helix domain-containing protein [Streptomonospora sediminis]
MNEKADPVWAQWGAELLRLRALAGKTQSELGHAALMSRQQVSALEKATRIPKSDHADKLDSVLATGGVLRRLWAELSDTRDVPAFFRDALKVERRATEIREYQSVVIPGLLQTSDYARAVIDTRHTRRTREQVDQVTNARTERLAAIVEQRPLLWFVMGAWLLSRPVGTARIMRRQLQHIIKLAEEGTIQLQILPSACVRSGLYAPFRLSVLSETRTVAYVEHALGGETYDRPEDIGELVTVFGSLQADALPPDDSVKMLENAMGALSE